MVHGIVASDRFAKSLFWGRIPDTLRRAGHSVFFGNTDSVGSVAGNAQVLKKSIEDVVRETGRPKVLLLAHSKGGIDSQRCLAEDQGEPKVAGLVSVCTPYGGSELADLVVSGLQRTGELSIRLMNALGRVFPDKNPELAAVANDLSTASMEVFSRHYPRRADVLYRPYHTRMHSAHDDLWLSQTYKTIHRLTGANDGIVSVASANFWKDSQEIAGNHGGISHIEVLDLKRRKISGVDIPEVWVEVVRSALAEL